MMFWRMRQRVVELQNGSAEVSELMIEAHVITNSYGYYRVTGCCCVGQHVAAIVWTANTNFPALECTRAEITQHRQDVGRADRQ